MNILHRACLSIWVLLLSCWIASGSSGSEPAAASVAEVKPITVPLTLMPRMQTSSPTATERLFT